MNSVLIIDLLDDNDSKEIIDLLSKLSNVKIPNLKKCENRYIYVAKLDGKIVGTGTLFILPKIHCDSVGLIEDIIIDEKYRKNGFGGQIIKKLSNIAFNDKCYKVMLDCSDKNLNFYKNNNFKKIGNNMAQYFT